MSAFDLINACFEFMASGAIVLNIRALLRHRRAAGFSGQAVAFYTVWGVWSALFLATMGQWASFTAACGIVAANAVYVALLIRFSGRECAA